MGKKLPSNYNQGINLTRMLNNSIGAQGASGTNWVGAIGGGGSTATISIGGSDLDTITLGSEMPQPYVNFALIKAHGGTIVQCRAEDTHKWEYYVIPDNVKNFDRELGKIISMQLLKG